jgi:ABC-type antimicrobial peptide transport system permease subunit
MMSNLAAAFGVLALILAMVGLYGIMAFSVARRTQEIDVRMALGARHASILRMVFRESMSPVLIGIGVGLPVTLMITRLVANRLFGVSAADPLTMFGATSLMLAVTGIASFPPAYRAIRVEPAVALRCE